MRDLSGSLFNVVNEPLVAGDSFELEFTIQNTEGDNADQFEVKFYLSDNEWISTSDKQLGSFTIDSLTGNTTTGKLTTKLTLPAAGDEFWKSDGAYYIGMIVDPANSVEETSEENNSNTGEFADLDPVNIKVTPDPVDLAGKLFNVVTEPLLAGANFAIDFEIENIQGGNAGKFQVKFYISDNDWISNNDRQLGSFTVNNLKGNTTTGALTKKLTLPTAEDEFWKGEREYYLGMIIDEANTIEESSKNNNSNQGEFADLDPVNITLPVDLAGKLFNVVTEPLLPGASFDLDFEIENIQKGNAGQFEVKFYLSDNDWISNNDWELGSFTVNGLNGNTTTGKLTKNLTLPGTEDEFWKSEGTYYFGMIIDEVNAVEESLEDNNSNTGEFTDLDPVNITFPLDLAGKLFDVVTEPVITGESFEVLFEIENTQRGNAGQFEVDFYISNDQLISDSDQQLKTVKIDSLAGKNTTGVLNTKLTIPIPDPENSFLPAQGPAYIGMLIDRDNVINEINENNNSSSGEFLDFDPVEVIIDEDSYENNDDLLTAYDLSNQENKWLSELNGLGIVKTEDEDWYKIEVSPGEENLVVELEFTHSEGDIDLVLRDALGNLEVFSNSTTDNEKIDINLSSAGTYYLQVQLLNSSQNTYDLLWMVDG
ncbi:MAG: pre-peptidase C-terminal domain-containing protein [Gomphosphaeria aponina SAG 52.96 = DSM 107014]|uniref:Pre-peptidase C-terminal domain-containing protein n=1 Tax=Gomphosphaeria aponina SAG 52.96 = DSM 107014 TaxID=1521640 RepID=A0A941JLX0_9CHRO|nr:pre-peptidase C-terminal domain-containing protein [Gomphosphaeria aponina SAG 52.96 = DSM 107014]